MLGWRTASTVMQGFTGFRVLGETSTAETKNAEKFGRKLGTGRGKCH